MYSYDDLKQICVDAASAVKEALEKLKEWRMLAHKTVSKASKKQ